MKKFFFLSFSYFLYAFEYPLHKQNNKITIPINQFIQKIEKHDFETIYFNQNINSVYSNEKNNNIYESNISPLITTKLVDISLENNVDTYFYENNQNNMNVFSFLIYGLLFSYFLQSFSRFSSFFTSFQKPNNQIILNNITLNDVCLSDEVKEECFEVVSYFKNNTDYKQIGAEIPKGILLEGPPGTGKTLIAKAIACESNVNFVSVSGSQFVELYVGLGALRIRKLFEEARKNKPTIIFIDEIDAIGKTRNPNSLNDERDQTLNQLLVEMDGFQKNDDIIVLASTNRKDILDNALLRPGRFDRIVNIPYPNSDSRYKMFELYLGKKKTENINIEEITEATSGFSGAEIKKIVNEAAIIALKKNRYVILQEDILHSIEKLSIGLVIKNDTRSDFTKRRVAIHECGHAMIAKIYSYYFDLKKVTIEPLNNGIGGFTLYNEKSNFNGLITKDFIKKKIMVYLGGKIAEEVFLGIENTSIGASLDLQMANQLAYDMIEKYGFGKNVPNYSMQNRISPGMKEKIDKEVNDLIYELYIETREIMKSKKEIINKLVNKLVIQNKLYDLDFVIV